MQKKKKKQQQRDNTNVITSHVMHVIMLMPEATIHVTVRVMMVTKYREEREFHEIATAGMLWKLLPCLVREHQVQVVHQVLDVRDQGSTRS